MSGKFWTQVEEKALQSGLEQGHSVHIIAANLGRSVPSVRHKIKTGVGPAETKLEVTTEKDHAVITSQSSTVRTLADALKTAKIDETIWEVERHIINKWDCVAKSKKDKLIATELWQVKVWLKRKIPKLIEEGVKEFIKQIPAHKYPPIKYERPSDPYLFEVSIWDHHFGKLCWGQETGENFDLKSAERIYSDAAHELIEKSRGFAIEKIVLPIGQDFFHIDGPANTTVAGTPQDVDGRFFKIFDVGCRSVINLIDVLMGIAPIHILWVPGNHDWNTSWFMLKVLAAHYRLIHHVTIDLSPMPRKHIEYGINLLGYTHGNEEKHSSLPVLMAGQWPEAWARTRHREWKIGHYHKVKETQFNAAETIDGVLVRTLPSLTGTDSWHYKKGYVGGMRAAQAFLYSAKLGYAAHLNANVRIS